MYSQDVIQEVRLLNDIVEVVSGYVVLSLRSGNHFGLCPFHREKSPSFSVNRDKQIFYCFGCNAGGNVISFIMRIENLSFVDALKLLASRAHFVLPELSARTANLQNTAKESAARINALAARVFHENLHTDTPYAATARSYLESRGITPELVRKFGLGLSLPGWSGLLDAITDAAPYEVAAAGLALQNKAGDGYYDRFRGRIMFPIIDVRGRVVGFGGRTFMPGTHEDEPKYINTPETALFNKSSQLYGINLAKKKRLQKLIIAEGYMDVVALHKHGFVQAVGVLGTALTQNHTRLLRTAGCTAALLVLDSDEAGVQAALRAIPLLIEATMKVNVLTLTDAKDPDEFLSSFGAVRFEKLLGEAPTHVLFLMEYAKRDFDLHQTDGRMGYTKECARILAAHASPIEIDVYCNIVASQTQISAAAIKAEASKLGATEHSPASAPNPLMRSYNPDADHAKSILMRFIFSEPAVARRVIESGQIDSEMLGGIYGKLYALMQQHIARGKHISVPDAIDFFEDDDDRRAIAEIFQNDRYNIEMQSTHGQSLLNAVANVKRPWLKEQLRIAGTADDRDATRHWNNEISKLQKISSI